MKLNRNFEKLQNDYLFLEVAQRTTQFQQQNPDCDIIKLGIGDVTMPLAASVVDALTRAANEMGQQETFRGYGAYQGYSFLREAVCVYYENRRVKLDIDEVFISDGAKSDIGNILDLFDAGNTVLIPSPVYPVYVDTNLMAGRQIVYIEGNQENDFLPLPDPSVTADIIYLCSPNNPSGAAYAKPQLEAWVAYAQSQHAVILYDAAYEAFVADDKIPKSIYEIDGAKTCAIEFCSLSKTAGFTGTRCGYTIVPNDLKCGQHSLNRLWLRRQSTKFNGVPYVIQRAAEAVFTPQGQREVALQLDYYRQNARMIADALTACNIWFSGGVHSPYLWLKCPFGLSSWEFFDFMLQKAQIVGTPGVGFGASGEGYFRLTAFSDATSTRRATERLRNVLKTR